MLKNLKLFLFKRQWRKNNAHNKTSAGNIFRTEQVTVGKETYGQINIVAPNQDRIEIGNYVSIAQDVHFVLGSHDYRRISTYPFQSSVYHIPTKEAQKIVVEDDVWIGYGAVILTGVTIGKGAVIGAKSVVTKDVPPYAVWVGNKVVKYRFSEEICEALAKIDYSSVSHVKHDAYEKFCQTTIDAANVAEILSAFTDH